MELDKLNGLLALKAVAEKRNFTVAATQFGVSPSAISQTIKQLEKRLGVTLLARTTRSTSLTQAGEQFLNQAGPALDQILAAMESVRSFADKPLGLLRLNMPKLAYVSYLAPLVTSFLKRYPDVSLELTFDDKQTDVIGKGFDAGVRLSDILAKDVTAFKIAGPVKFIVVASPSYLKHAGYPKHPRDLLNHRCICPALDTGPYEWWDFEEKGKDFTVHVKPAVIINDLEIMLDAAADGLGIAYATEDGVRERIQKGKLEVLLPQYAATSTGFFLYYPKLSQAMPKLRAFVEHIKSARKIS